MIQQTTAPTKTRIPCQNTGKLIATLDNAGIYVYCLYQKRPELVSVAKCMETWGASPLAWESLSTEMLSGIMETISGVLIARRDAVV